MKKSSGVLAVACWCVAAAAANAQYGPALSGQPAVGPVAPPSADYYNNYNAYQRQLAANSGYNYTPVNNGWNANPGSQTSTGFPYNTGRTTLAQATQGVPTPAYPEQSPGDLLPGNQSVPSFNDSGNSTVVPPGTLPTPDNAGLNSAGIASGFGGGCSTGNCGTPCCQPSCGCSAGWMGPGPLFYQKGCGLGGFGGLGLGGGCGTGGCGIGTGGGYGGSAFQQSVAGCGDAGSACGMGGLPGIAGFVPTTGFYAQAGGLILRRDRGNRNFTSFDEANQNNQIMNSQQATPGTGYGGQITIGHCITCNSAVEATYWGLANSNGYSTVLAPTAAGVGTPYDSSFLPNFANGNSVSHYFDGSGQQSIWRTDSFQNIELNVLGFPTVNPMSRFRAAMLGGFRYFSFTDQMIFGAASFGTTFSTPNNSANEAFLYSKTTNTLLGFQIGARLSYFLTPRFALFATPKMGLFNNHMTQAQSLYTGDGIYNFNLNASSNGLAVLGEIDLGGQYYITPRLAVFGAYRLVGISGVALADNVTPHYLNEFPVMQTVNRNGDVLLQGLYTGMQFNF